MTDVGVGPVRYIDVCDHGYEIPKCMGCLTAIDPDQPSGTSAALGRLCGGCFAKYCSHSEPSCDLCTARVLERWPDDSVGTTSQHRQAHSTVLDTCVDADLLPFLEGFHAEVAPTFASCQGEPWPDQARAAANPLWWDSPYVMADTRGRDWRAVAATVLDWAATSGDRHHLVEVEVRPHPVWNSVTLRFAALPRRWLG